MIVVVMGVAGAGKTTVGRLLADRLDADFLDADDFHPDASVEKMRRGTPLTDEDRWPWLARLNEALRERTDRGRSVVLACSALKAAYRTRLAEGIPAMRVVFLNGPRELIASRMAARRDHYMNPGLLDSQLATLEPPADAIEVAIDGTPDAIVARAFAALRGAGDRGGSS